MTPSELQLLEDARKRWADAFSDLQEALRQSEIITEEDLSITINAVGD